MMKLSLALAGRLATTSCSPAVRSTSATTTTTTTTWTYCGSDGYYRATARLQWARPDLPRRHRRRQLRRLRVHRQHGLRGRLLLRERHLRRGRLLHAGQRLRHRLRLQRGSLVVRAGRPGLVRLATRVPAGQYCADGTCTATCTCTTTPKPSTRATATATSRVHLHARPTRPAPAPASATCNQLRAARARGRGPAHRRDGCYTGAVRGGDAVCDAPRPARTSTTRRTASRAAGLRARSYNGINCTKPDGTRPARPATRAARCEQLRRSRPARRSDALS